MFEKGLKTPTKIYARSIFLQLLILHFSFGLIFGAAYPNARQQGDRQALGSLSTDGEVYINSVGAPAASSIFAGDVLRTSGTGTATFTVADSGSLRISPNTEMVFAGSPQYAAELKVGKVVMNSVNGPIGITVRAGSSVVVAVAEGEQSTSSIEAPSDGSFFITCLGGSVGVVPLQGGKGIFITRGQSAGVSSQGELSAVGSPAAPVAEITSAAAPTAAATPPFHSSNGPEPAARQRHSHWRWILIGAAVAGAGVAAAILSANGSGGSASPAISVGSPSSSTSSGTSPGDPAPSQPTPSPVPPQPTPPPPSPPTCPKHHHEKNCQPNVVIGFSLHF